MPAYRVPDMGKRQLMNLLWLGAIVAHYWHARSLRAGVHSTVIPQIMKRRKKVTAE